MSNWIKCTTTDGIAAYVNLENATSIFESGPDQTVINFIGGTSIVAEGCPEEIIPRTDR
jgi:hypothetical protein